MSATRRPAATTSSTSRSRPKKKSASTSWYGSRPRNGERPGPPPAGSPLGGADSVEELLDRELVEVDAAVLPEPRLERRRLRVDRPRPRDAASADGSVDAAEHDAQVPVPEAVAEEEESALLERLREDGRHGLLLQQPRKELDVVVLRDHVLVAGGEQLVDRAVHLVDHGSFVQVDVQLLCQYRLRLRRTARPPQEPLARALVGRVDDEVVRASLERLLDQVVVVGRHDQEWAVDRCQVAVQARRLVVPCAHLPELPVQVVAAADDLEVLRNRREIGLCPLREVCPGRQARGEHRPRRKNVQLFLVACQGGGAGAQRGARPEERDHRAVAKALVDDPKWRGQRAHRLRFDQGAPAYRFILSSPRRTADASVTRPRR